MILFQSALVAQWTEQVPSKHKVVGSNPAGGAFLIDSIGEECVEW